MTRIPPSINCGSSGSRDHLQTSLTNIGRLLVLCKGWLAGGRLSLTLKWCFRPVENSRKAPPIDGFRLIAIGRPNRLSDSSYPKLTSQCIYFARLLYNRKRSSELEPTEGPLSRNLKRRYRLVAAGRFAKLNDSSAAIAFVRKPMLNGYYSFWP